MPDRRPSPWGGADQRAEADQRVGLSELLARATDRAALDGAPGKSGAEMERLMIDSQPYVLKRLDLARDWTLRASGCLPGPPLVLWQDPRVLITPHVGASTPVSARTAGQFVRDQAERYLTGQPLLNVITGDY